VPDPGQAGRALDAGEAIEGIVGVVLGVVELLLARAVAGGIVEILEVRDWCRAEVGLEPGESI
jgi:hypothetical protein